MLKYVTAATVAKAIGTSRQNIARRAKLAMKPEYSGKLIKPDALVDDVPVWLAHRLITGFEKD
jgi:hypothetical protein